MLSKLSFELVEKKTQFVRSFTKKNFRKFFIKIEEMADIFLNSANFAKHTFSTLAQPSGYALNLKALIKVSKVSLTSWLSYEILRSLFERKFDKANFIFLKETSQKPVSFRVKIIFVPFG